LVTSSNLVAATIPCESSVSEQGIRQNHQACLATASEQGISISKAIEGFLLTCDLPPENWTKNNAKFL
jgi:hypothetical protein